MGFVMRLNSRDLVNDPKNGAEVYPITATNAVYRVGTDKNLEQILSELSNNQDRKVIQDLEYLSNTNTLRISYTDNTTDNIQLSNLVKNVVVTKNNRTHTITVTPTTGNVSTYTIELPNVTTSGTGNGLSDISYNSSTNTIIATKSTFLTEHQQIPVTDVKVNNASVVTNKVANITLPTIGILNTNNSQAQTASSSESFSNNISLHKISKTGNYNDLLNKPTIPSVQIQSDWNQSDNTQLDYIKNKPTIPTAIQSDWNQADNTQADYIKNKPTIPASQVNSDWNAASGVAQILNKPTIPDAQIQSDWNQTNTSAKDYIKNKPNVVTDVRIRNTSVVTNKVADMDVVKNNNSIYAVQYVSSEDAYNAIQSKDPNTLYFIPVENS